jgi:hypothetical protein
VNFDLIFTLLPSAGRYIASHWSFLERIGEKRLDNPPSSFLFCYWKTVAKIVAKMDFGIGNEGNTCG